MSTIPVAPQSGYILLWESLWLWPWHIQQWTQEETLQQSKYVIFGTLNIKIKYYNSSMVANPVIA